MSGAVARRMLLKSSWIQIYDICYNNRRVLLHFQRWIIDYLSTIEIESVTDSHLLKRILRVSGIPHWGGVSWWAYTQKWNKFHNRAFRLPPHNGRLILPTFYISCGSVLFPYYRFNFTHIVDLYRYCFTVSTKKID